jgi:UDP-glucose 4-epimerase
MRLLITGVEGFLGRGVGRLATAFGYEVLGIRRRSRPEGRSPCTYVQEDIASPDYSAVIRDFAPDVILHAAGPASVSSSFTAPLDDLRAGILSWANTLDSIRRSKHDPLVLFPSSAAVYGNPITLPIIEESVVAPISPYGFHKAACELLAREYSACFGLDIVICRLFSIFGPDQRRLLVWELYQKFKGPGSDVWLDGSGEEIRDYLSMDDTAAALLQLTEILRSRIQNHRTALCNNQIINVASGKEIRVLNVAQLIGQRVGSSKPIRCRHKEQQGDPWYWRADISRLRSVIPSWQPKPLQMSLSDCIAAWESEHDRFAGHVPTQNV